MPVLGHAFVAVTTAVYTRPAERRRIAVALWTPILVGLAYLPDITAQLAGLTGLVPAGTVRVATHSFLFAAVASLILGLLLGRMAGISFIRGCMIAAISIAGHVLLDLLQGSDSYPLWPFSRRLTDLPFHLIPGGMRGEVWVLGGICGALIASCLAIRLVRQGWMPLRTALLGDRRAWGAHVLTVLFLVLAVGTHRLREVRVRQLDQARALIRDGRAAEALLLLDEADHWPNTAGPGRVDYGRAEAYLQLKDRYRAEIHYHRACEADPAFYWALADLALFYANAPEPLAQRQRQAEPYIALLKERFAKSPQLPGLLKKLGRKLGPAATQTARR